MITTNKNSIKIDTKVYEKGMEAFHYKINQEGS